MKHPRRMAGVAAIVGALLFAPDAETTPLRVDPNLSMEGRGLTVALGGVGLELLGEGSETISVGIGGPVHKALLYWAGRDYPCPEVDGVCVIPEPYKDQELILDGTPILGGLIGAEQNAFSLGAMNSVGYRADVTDIVRARGLGTQIFTIEDGDLSSNFEGGLNGAALLVFYTDESDASRYAVTVFEGLDFAWYNAGDPDARVTTAVEFVHPPADGPRLADLYVAVGDAEGGRSDRIHISDNASIEEQLDGSAGRQWDSDVFKVIITAGTASTSVEVVSPPPPSSLDQGVWDLSAARRRPVSKRANLSNPDALSWLLAVLRVPVAELACVPGQPCDDGDACTTDVCDAEGNCVGTPFDPAIECDDENVCTVESCDPAIGCVNTPDEGAPCDDGDACTVDVCDAQGVCVSTPIDPAIECDDGAECTLDTCDPVVGCRNIDVNTLGCVGVEDCPPAAIDCVEGHCLCEELPELCLYPVGVVGDPPPVAGCGLEQGDPLEVVVRMSFSTTPICAAQFFLAYDVDALEFVEIIPGGWPVFSTVLFESVDAELGTIDYVVGANPGNVCTGTNGPAVVATIRFNAIGSCETDGVWFRPNNPPTRLGAADGSEVCPVGHFDLDGICGTLVDPCDTGELIIESTPPEFVNCPELDAGIHADCGNITKQVNWDPVVAIDNCDGSVPVECTASNSRGASVDYLADSGGRFPVGDTTITCVAQDSCGHTAECVFVVSNSGLNALHLDLELSPTMSLGPVTRGIEVIASECRDEPFPPPYETCVDVTFGGPHNLPDHGSVLVPVPAGLYECVEVRDRFHTLPATCEVFCVTIPGEGEVWYGAFEGVEGAEGACHWLVNGNLTEVECDGRVRIDILDYVAFVDAVTKQPFPPPDTPCGFTGLHADINGDGQVDRTDFSFIMDNLFRHDKAGCDWVCYGDGGAAPTIVLRDSISVSELAGLGFLNGHLADLNSDGVVNLKDLFLYANSP